MHDPYLGQPVCIISAIYAATVACMVWFRSEKWVSKVQFATFCKSALATHCSPINHCGLFNF